MNRCKHFAIIILLCCGLSHSWAQPKKVAADYSDLESMFIEFREFQKPKIVNGASNYSQEAMQEQFQGVKKFQERLAAMDISAWPISQKVDFLLVKGEVNAFEFYHRVLEPWKHDPGFYSFRGGDAGASMDLGHLMDPLFKSKHPFNKKQKLECQAAIDVVPKMFEQAKRNLTEASGDLADLAIRNGERDAKMFESLASVLEKDHKDLSAKVKQDAKVIRDFGKWLTENKAKMTARAGVGKENYSWWMKNVQMSPWGWEENNAIIQREYDRIITFLKLEEQRNRNLPPLKVAISEREWNKNLRQALHYVVGFMRDNEIMTIDNWVNPADYYYGRHGANVELSELSDSVSYEFLPGNSSIDTKVRQREILPGETHEYIGHMLDYQRQERLTLSKIRKADRRFNMGSMRLEGWAVSLEELLMQAGVLDERPRNGREMEYLMNASHMSLSIPDMKIHANEINLAEARRLCAEIMPRGWSRPDEDMVWFEMQSNLRNPGGFHSNVVTGKAYFLKLFRERAVQLGDKFVIKDFIDEFLSYGIIPMPLIRWEMTGNDDELKKLLE